MIQGHGSSSCRVNLVNQLSWFPAEDVVIDLDELSLTDRYLFLEVSYTYVQDLAFMSHGMAYPRFRQSSHTLF